MIRSSSRSARPLLSQTLTCSNGASSSSSSLSLSLCGACGAAAASARVASARGAPRSSSTRASFASGGSSSSSSSSSVHTSGRSARPGRRTGTTMMAPIPTAYRPEHLDRRIELGRTRPSARCGFSSTTARSEAGPSSTPPLTVAQKSTPDAPSTSPVPEAQTQTRTRTRTDGFIPSIHPLLTPQLLLQSDTTTELPSPQDLEALQPRRFTIPSRTSPESHRVVYSRAWAQTYEALSHAFNKSQLLHLAGPLGLSLDPLGEASKMRARTRGKKYLNKTLGMMNKKELCVTLMVLKWGMVDPAAVPAAAKGPKATQAIPLSDRTLFLLLSPSSTTFSHLSANHSLRFSFQQDPQTSTLNLIVSGPEASVLVAQETIGSIAETADRRDFVLPDSTRSLPAEVYQTISRNAKVYLEAPEDAKESDSVLRATTNDKKGLETAERLLGLAFAEARKARTTHLIVSNAGTDKDGFCFVPFGPISSPAFPNDSTSSFARLVDVNRRSRDGGEEIKTTGSSDVLSRINNMRSLLPNSAESTTKHGLKATFGHLLFPLYPSSSTPVFGSVALDDVTSLPPHRHFLSCPPTGFLSSTGATKPTPASGLSNPSKNVYDLPFFSDLSDEEDADDPLDRLNQLALDSPDLSSEAFRRIRYVRKPRALQPSDSLEQILEVVYLPHQDLLTRTHVRSTYTNVLYPSHSTDLALSASHQELLATTALTGFEKSYLPSRTPLELEYAGEDWLLSSDRQVRRTQVGELRIERWVEISSRGEEGAQMGVEVEWVTEDGKYGVEEWFKRVEGRVMLKVKEH